MPVFLFSDIEGSTQKWETYRDLMAKALAAHDQIMLSCMNRFGGKIIKNTGDGVFAMFENRSALQCALTLQEEIGKADWTQVKGLKVRLALHAGEAEKRGEDYFGPVINRTARVLATGWGGQIVLTPDALAASDVPEEAVTEQLGTHLLKDLSDPQPLMGLVHATDPEKFPPLRSLSSRPNNLPPQSTPFFGREKELEQIAKHLKDPSCRMITLVGQGGMGKTRLSLQAAAERLDDFSDGVYFVALAPINNPDDLVSAIANAVGFFFSGNSEMSQQLLRYLKDRSMLIVLDSFEHLLVGASFVQEMINVAPKLKILASSRFRMNLQEEWIMELEGMSYPKDGDREPLDHFSAVRFFVTCAQRSQKNFSLTEADGKEVARICRLVDGIPLGIELGAAWVRTLSCQEIREEIEKNLDFLASKHQGVSVRHRSLRAVFEYSWSILSEEEKNALQALSVFRGGFLRDAAEKVTGCSLFLLSALLDKSLLHKSHSKRFEMHELIRQFSEEKLKASPEKYQTVREKHSEYYCEFLAVREEKLAGPQADEIIKEISEESSNIASAWQWAVEKKNVKAISGAIESLYQYFEFKCLSKEGDEFYGLVATAFSDPAILGTSDGKLTFARAAMRQGWFCSQQGKLEKAEMLIKKALDITRELKKDNETGTCLHFLCSVYSAQRKYDQHEMCAKESYGIFKRLEHELCIAWSLYHMAQKPQYNLNYEMAKKYFSESLALFRKLGNDTGLAWNLVNLGQIARTERNFQAAKGFYNESLGIFKKRDNKISAGMILLDLAHVHEDLEEHETAYQFAQQAYECFLSSANRSKQAWAQLLCADIAFYAGKWEESLRAGLSALHLFFEEEDLVWQGWACSILCRANNKGGQFEEARIYAQKGIEIFRKLGDKEGMGACQYYLGYSEIGLNNLAEAESLFMSALENGMVRKIHWRIMDAILGLAVVKGKMGNPALGLFLAGVLQKDTEIGKDLKQRTLEFVSEFQPKVSKSELKVIDEKIKPFTVETLAAQLIAQK